MSTAPSTKKSDRIQNTVAVAIVGIGIMVSSFGFAQAAEPAPAPAPATAVTSAPVHVSNASTVGGVLGR